MAALVNQWQLKTYRYECTVVIMNAVADASGRIS